MIKKLIILLFPFYCNAATYYISPSGSDGGSGAIGSPWFTFNKAWTVLAAGDFLYCRGGTYNYTVQQDITSLSGSSGNLITIENYPGEVPIFTQDNSYPVDGQDLFIFAGSYFLFKGLQIFDCDETTLDWAAFRSEGCSNVTFENILYSYNQLGFTVRECNNILFLNCDFYYNEDAAGDNADGLNITYISNGSYSNTVRGCRAFNNSDDGFDFWANEGYVLIENSWSWHNGYRQNGTTEAGDGSGFKFGQYTAAPTSTLKRTARECVSYDNKLWGFNENNCQTRIDLYNNTAYDNGTGGTGKNYWFGDWGNHVMNVTNNIHYVAPEGYTFNGASIVETTNSWQVATVTDADFQSLSGTLGNPRQSNGSLPDITFLHLAASSDMRGVGTEVCCGTDLGAFQYSSEVFGRYKLRKQAL